MDRAFVTATLIVVLASWAPYVPTAAVAQTAPDDAAAPAKFSADQIDQMVAPVALYPDALLAQIFIASTYPLEIVEADRWRRQNASLKDDALDKALEQKDWDPSVKSLTKMPDLLKRLSDNLDWTKDLGDAFLAQKDDVMSAVQAMRQKASEAGNLKTSEQQTVTKEVVNNKETIVIQPTNPETVYVPSYPPTVYGSTYAPTTPYYGAPAYGYTGAQMATTGLLAFGTGIAVGALVSDGFGWGSNDVHVNNNYYGNGGGGGGGNNNNNNNNANVNVNKNVDRSKTVNKGGQSWQHNPEHRRNVEYRDPSTQKKFDSRNPNAARDRQARDQARGFDSGNAGNRGGAGDRGGAGNRGDAGNRGGAGDRGGAGNRGDVGNRGGAGNRGDVGNRGDAGNRGGGDRGGNRGGAGGQGGDRGQTRSASAGKSGALGDYGSGQASRQASQRGASSRGSQSYAGAGGGGQRGGGGGGGQRASGGGGGGRGGGGGGSGGGRGGGGGGGGRGGGGGGRRR